MTTNTRTSKFLSLLLRHQPEAIGLTIDPQGWADVDELIAKANATGRNSLTRAEIEQVVATNPKQRFDLSSDGRRIRANQGHSIDVDLQLESVEPPATLFHGTATRFLEPIMAQGLVRRSRQHVHLSADRDTASTVGTRHGKLAMLQVDAAAMHAAGHEFFLSKNNVWLTDHVPAEFLTCQ